MRTMYRILTRRQGPRTSQSTAASRTTRSPSCWPPRPNQVWSWDITKLLGPAKWTYYYLYVILDIFSRYVVGWMLAHRESADLANAVDSRDDREARRRSEDQLTIHSDRGPSMKSHTVAQLLATLGVTKSHSRPHVSNDNPFSESQFKTLKYRPEFPDRFGELRRRLEFLPRVFPLVQRRALPLGHRPADAGDAPLRTALRMIVACASGSPASGLRGPSGAIRPQAFPTAGVARRPCGSIRRANDSAADEQKKASGDHCSQKPDAPLTHPRSGYPSSSCVPAELDSVSPGKANTYPMRSRLTTTFEHPSHASKNPGGLGDWSPSEASDRLAKPPNCVYTKFQR